MTVAEKPQMRRATNKDLPVLLGLEALFTSDRMSKRSIQRFIRKKNIWIAIHGSKVSGSIVLTRRSNSLKARIYSVIVAPSARGLGIGDTLVAHAEKVAQKDGCTDISLEVRGDNTAAQALYKKRGYSVVKQLPEYYDDKADGLRLTKILH